jgi:hypothetical protein
LGKTVLFFEVGVFDRQRLFDRRGGLRRPLRSLVGKQLPAAVVDGSE